MGRESGIKVIARNKRARFDFLIEEVFEAGLVLTGTEVKSLREGRANISEAYATIEAGEPWLENAYIPEFIGGSWTNHPPRRKRKLLLGRKEISKLSGAVSELGVTLVPMAIYFKGGYAKLEIGLARGKKAVDKREALKAKDAQREIQKTLKAANRGSD
jgi:SsrA-binding protein